MPHSLLVLVGNVGSSFWPSFSGSEEARDGIAHPLDRWSQRIASVLAARCGAQAYYPFGGPPYHSFLRWAAKAESLGASPLGLRMHPVYGLWHAYRFALQIPICANETEQVALTPSHPGDPDLSPLSNICIQCTHRVCLSTCPVKAFTPEAYDVGVCASYLHTTRASGQPSACETHSCQARLACPVGAPYQYTQAHGQFHMQQFMTAHRQTLNRE